jgi:hypothetical protein
MAISYPVALPTHTGIAQIELRAINAVAYSSSPFTFAGQAHAYPGQMWQAEVSLPPMLTADAEQWLGFLLSLRGQFGTFLLGDPLRTSPRGTATSATITGSAGDSSVSVTMTGTLLAGDYLQLGSADGARLHKVVKDQSGSGTLEIWPALRVNRSSASATLTNAQGVFRLSSNEQAWSINEASIYGITFAAREAI